MDLTWEFLYAALVVFGASVIRGYSGFGFAIISAITLSCSYPRCEDEDVYFCCDYNSLCWFDKKTKRNCFLQFCCNFRHRPPVWLPYRGSCYRRSSSDTLLLLFGPFSGRFSSVNDCFFSVYRFSGTDFMSLVWLARSTDCELVRRDGCAHGSRIMDRQCSVWETC